MTIDFKLLGIKNKHFKAFNARITVYNYTLISSRR